MAPDMMRKPFVRPLLSLSSISHTGGSPVPDAPSWPWFPEASLVISKPCLRLTAFPGDHTAIPQISPKCCQVPLRVFIAGLSPILQCACKIQVCSPHHTCYPTLSSVRLETKLHWTLGSRAITATSIFMCEKRRQYSQLNLRIWRPTSKFCHVLQLTRPTNPFHCFTSSLISS